MSMKYRPAMKTLLALAAISLVAVFLGTIATLRAPRADAAGFVFPSMGTACVVSGGTTSVRLRLSARSFFTTITHVTLDVGGGPLEYDSGAIATTSFGPQIVNVPLTPGVYPIVMTVSSTGNPDVTRTATATIGVNSCRVRSP